MPELIEQMYCSQQIVIPPKFPYILKRYCKAAIKTQPYDLLRWSFEYFKALAQNRPPPVKLRLEYPVYSTEGGLTRGCLKVLAQQLSSMTDIPLPVLKQAWQGFCLDNEELKRILCLCEVYRREESVPFLNFLAVAGGMLTKTLTHTMILLCETLTKEPDGGSAAIPVDQFLAMYRFLALIDASKDVKYFNGYREGQTPEPEPTTEEIETQGADESVEEESSEDYWQDIKLRKVSLINDKLPHSARISLRLSMPLIGKIERSPSIERAGEIERENYMMERKGKAAPDEDVNRKLKELSAANVAQDEQNKEDKKKPEEEKNKSIAIIVYNEEGVEIPCEFYGEPKPDVTEEQEGDKSEKEDSIKDEEPEDISEFVAKCFMEQNERRNDLEQTFEEIASIVDKFKTANYDLGMVAGRQMSTTSGEFIVQHVEKDIMDEVNEQIAVLPDPDLKKKKAKPEEVDMIRNILKTYLDENIDVIVPEEEEIEEEELTIPEVTVVYAVPGIGPPVMEDIIKEVEDYALDVSKVQADMIMPRNIRHFLCPPLEKYVEFKFEHNQEENEPLPVANTA